MQLLSVVRSLHHKHDKCANFLDSKQTADLFLELDQKYYLHRNCQLSAVFQIKVQNTGGRCKS